MRKTMEIKYVRQLAACVNSIISFKMVATLPLTLKYMFKLAVLQYLFLEIFYISGETQKQMKFTAFFLKV